MKKLEELKKMDLKKIGMILQLLIVGIMLYFIHHELKAYSFASIKSALSAIPVYKLILAVFLVILNYLILTGYELLAFNVADIKLEKHKIMFTSFVSYAFANFIGLSGLSSTGIRINMYSLWNINYKSIIKIIKNVYLSFLIGVLLVGGISQIAFPNDLRRFNFMIDSTFFIGVGAVLAGMFLIFYFVAKQQFTLRDIFIQFLLGLCDWLLISNILYLFLPNSNINFGTFLSIFMCSQVLGVMSTIPGGLGVFDVVFVKLLNNYYTNDVVIAVLIVYRILYYLAPFLIALVSFIFYRLLRIKDVVTVKGMANFLSNLMVNISLELLSILVFSSGALLLFSGALPPNLAHLKILEKLIPENIIIISHLLASITGTLLLILAYGLKRRLDIAYFMTLILISFGNIFLIFKGFHYPIFFVLSITLIFLLFARNKFYRKSSFLNEDINIKWVISIGAVIVLTILLGFFSFRDVKYSDELWWQFTLNNGAPMFLRASLVSVMIFVIFLMLRMFRPVVQIEKIKSIDVQEEIKNIMKFSSATNSNLALLDDKFIYFNEDKSNFIMYGKSNKRLIVMGDPVGEESKIRDTIWDFYNISKRSGYNIAFYEVNKNYLNYYLDIGLKLFKIGEEAVVDLTKFTLEGSSQRKLRYTFSKCTKAGLIFDVVEYEPVKDKLREISDSWLKNKNGMEKEFSLGKFDDDYLKNFRIAILKLNDEIVAFANLWETANKEELSIDLMRYNEKALTDSMEYLFIHIMLWGKEEGYKNFNLGMAPLSGLEYRGEASSLWNRLGAFIFKNGGNFYNFLGLKNFKNKFNPTWKPKYIALSGNFTLPTTLNDIAVLVSGGIKGVRRCRRLRTCESYQRLAEPTN